MILFQNEAMEKMLLSSSYITPYAVSLQKQYEGALFGIHVSWY